VIRPDKYIGYRGDTIDFETVHEYFRALGSHPDARASLLAQK
jgi:hypothetical protein